MFPPLLRHAPPLLLLTVLSASVSAAQDTGHRWKVHDPDRPKPPVVTPGAQPGLAPSDAVVLFDGRSLDEWTARDGSPARWVVGDGYMQTVPGAGAIVSRRAFGDVQLHVEWSTPSPAVGTGQGRGNSGIYFMDNYEVQVLDSYRNQTYADGQAAALYGQHPPLVNASRPPGEWQSYDVVFRRPRFGANGALVSPARMTVFHNGVLVQDNAELWGRTNWLVADPYARHPDALPFVLQDHDHPVRYRNFWVRPLPDPPSDERGPRASRPRISLSPTALQRFVGTYRRGAETVAVVTRRGAHLFLDPFGRGVQIELIPRDATSFDFQHTAGTAEFISEPGRPARLIVRVAEVEATAERIP
ncbi:MAG TPA: DUF1080 domain-containing protein [Gemmatimonadaceae bacterium]|nr:MAG: hypothetical protein ABS52_02415 [Gemmatimonadetes bacterium SCN 70-22]HMN07496.1 DUF1080 domain-containing protein [Gemmatimonadaceae bacterium]